MLGFGLQRRPGQALSVLVQPSMMRLLPGCAVVQELGFALGAKGWGALRLPGGRGARGYNTREHFMSPA
jgi:hypothetical protein